MLLLNCAALAVDAEEEPTRVDEAASAGVGGAGITLAEGDREDVASTGKGLSAIRDAPASAFCNGSGSRGKLCCRT